MIRPLIYLDMRSMPPRRIRSPEWRTPIWQTIVTDLDLSRAAAMRETSLGLTAHEDHKVGAFACLGAQCFV
jgi:hypothetical protein